jgi:hypothetical protein
MSQEVLFCYRPGGSEEYQNNIPRVRKLIAEAFPAPQYKITPFEVNINCMEERMKQLSLPFFSKPIAIFYNSTEYGRLDEGQNWAPLITKCQWTAIVHALDLDSQDDKFKEKSKLYKETWGTIFNDYYSGRKHTVINLDKNQQSFTPQQLADLQVVNQPAPEQSMCRLV